MAGVVNQAACQAVAQRLRAELQLRLLESLSESLADQLTGPRLCGMARGQPGQTILDVLKWPARGTGVKSPGL